MGLEVNEAKTKYMKWSDEEYNMGRKLTVRLRSGKVYNFEEVERFVYLGTVFTRKPDISEEIRTRLLAGNRCIMALRNVIYNKVISRSLKLQIYKTVIRPIVTFGSEVWTLKKCEQSMLCVWERKVLRKIFRGKLVDGMWQRRSNYELQELYKEPNIVGIVKAQRLRWLGHIVRMPEERVPKRILKSEIGGRKRRGRPRERWRDEVEEDVRLYLKSNCWNQDAQNRKLWSAKIDQAMGLLGSQC